MSYAPASITAAAKVWTAHGGTNLGIVGSPRTHCRGYHLGRDRIYSTCACKPNGYTCVAGERGNDYSVQLSRDRAGLTNAAMALDLGRLNGSLVNLRHFTVWLFAQCRADTADTQDIREVIGTTDGKVVVNWLRDRGTDSAPRVGGDSTHLIHTHISYYRDTEGKAKTALFSRYFAGAPEPPDTGTDPGKDEDLNPTTQKPVAVCDVRSGGTLYAKEDRSVIVSHDWGGGDGIQLFSRPVVKKLADGRAGLAAIRVDTLSGPAEELHVYYVGDDLISNVRIP